MHEVPPSMRTSSARSSTVALHASLLRRVSLERPRAVLGKLERLAGLSEEQIGDSMVQDGTIDGNSAVGTILKDCWMRNYLLMTTDSLHGAARCVSCGHHDCASCEVHMPAVRH